VAAPPDRAALAMAAGAALRPPGTAALFPVPLQSTAECLTYFVSWLQIACGMITSFIGYGAKILLSSMFIQIFGLGDLLAGYLSALSLVLFACGRFGVPWFLMDSPRFGASAMLIRLFAQFATCVIFAVLPTVVGEPRGGLYFVEPPAPTDDAFSWSLFGFVVIKSAAGLTFAVSAVVSGAMGVQVFGSANLRYIMVPGWLSFGIAGAAGPITSYLTAQRRAYDGMSFANAYSLYFYLVAGLAGLNVCIIGLIYALERRAVNAEIAKHSESLARERPAETTTNKNTH